MLILNKGKWSNINDRSFYLKRLKKEDDVKLKFSKGKGMVNIKVDMWNTKLLKIKYETDKSLSRLIHTKVWEI